MTTPAPSTSSEGVDDDELMREEYVQMQAERLTSLHAFLRRVFGSGWRASFAYLRCLGDREARGRVLGILGRCDLAWVAPAAASLVGDCDFLRRLANARYVGHATRHLTIDNKFLIELKVLSDALDEVAARRDGGQLELSAAAGDAVVEERGAYAAADADLRHRNKLAALKSSCGSVAGLRNALEHAIGAHATDAALRAALDALFFVPGVRVSLGVLHYTKRIASLSLHPDKTGGATEGAYQRLSNFFDEKAARVHSERGRAHREQRDVEEAALRASVSDAAGAVVARLQQLPVAEVVMQAVDTWMALVERAGIAAASETKSGANRRRGIVEYARSLRPGNCASRRRAFGWRMVSCYFR